MTSYMQKKSILCLLVALLLSSCSPRDFLTRRLAADLISTSPLFRAPQQYVLQTGIVSNKDFVSPEYLARLNAPTAGTVGTVAAL